MHPTAENGPVRRPLSLTPKKRRRATVQMGPPSRARRSRGLARPSSESISLKRANLIRQIPRAKDIFDSSKSRIVESSLILGIQNNLNERVAGIGSANRSKVDGSISRKHILLERNGFGFIVLKDLGSTNGTYLLNRRDPGLEQKLPEGKTVDLDDNFVIRLGTNNTYLVASGDQVCILERSQGKNKVIASYQFRGVNRQEFFDPKKPHSGPYNIQSTKNANPTSSRRLRADETQKATHIYKRGETVHFKGDHSIQMIADGFFKFSSGAVSFDSKYKTITIDPKDSESCDSWIIYFISDRGQPDAKFVKAMDVLSNDQLEGAHQYALSCLERAEREEKPDQVEKFKAFKEAIARIYDNRNQR